MFVDNQIFCSNTNVMKKNCTLLIEGTIIMPTSGLGHNTRNPYDIDLVIGGVAVRSHAATEALLLFSLEFPENGQLGKGRCRLEERTEELPVSEKCRPASHRRSRAFGLCSRNRGPLLLREPCQQQDSALRRSCWGTKSEFTPTKVSVVETAR